jgi:hypothetical protein
MLMVCLFLQRFGCRVRTRCAGGIRQCVQRSHGSRHRTQAQHHQRRRPHRCRLSRQNSGGKKKRKNGCFTPTHRHTPKHIKGTAGHIIVTPANQLLAVGQIIWSLPSPEFEPGTSWSLVQSVDQLNCRSIKDSGWKVLGSILSSATKMPSAYPLCLMLREAILPLLMWNHLQKECF